MRVSYFHSATHLNEEQLLPPSDACPICASNHRIQIAKLQDDPDIYLLFCENCYAASASRMPTETTLREYYSTYYHDNDKSVTFDIPKRLSRHIFNNTRPHLDMATRIDILDFGGGDGEISLGLAEMLVRDGASEVHIDVVDYNTEAAQTQDRITMECFSELSGIKGRRYEIVIASAILEHIPHPSATIDSLLEALGDDGVFYARTPFVTPFFRIAHVLGFKLDFTYPGHVHDMGRDFWENIVPRLKPKFELAILKSKTSIVESSLTRHFFRTILAYLLKAPSYFNRRYNLVGGWEIFIKKTTSHA